MQLEQFIKLSVGGRQRAILRYGTFIENLVKGTSCCDVYKMSDFYVGVYFPLNENVAPTISLAVPSPIYLSQFYLPDLKRDNVFDLYLN
jgi:hypothetical protein